MCHRQKTDKMAIPQLAELTLGVGMAEKTKTEGNYIRVDTMCFFIGSLVIPQDKANRLRNVSCEPVYAESPVK